MTDQFDIDQGIMSCSNVTSELGLLLEELMENQSFTRDDAANFVLGLQRIYESKFDKLYRDFESFSKDYFRLKTELDNTRDELFRQRENVLDLEEVTGCILEANIELADAAERGYHGMTLDELLSVSDRPEDELLSSEEIWRDAERELIEDEWTPK